MTTIFKYFIYALVFFILSFENISAKTIQLNVSGRGENYKLAVADGLKEAIAQALGVTINANEVISLSSSVKEQSENNDILSKQEFSKQTHNDIFAKMNGVISSYQVISDNKSDDGTYIVDMVVDIEKYDVPGIENNRRGIAVLAFKADNATCMGQKINQAKQIEEITNNLVNSLTATRKFAVLDRDNEDVYNLEKELLQSNDVKLSERAKLAQVKGSDYILTGSIKSLSINSQRHKIELSGDEFTTYSAYAEVDFKLLAFASRQVKFASTVKVSLGNSEISTKKCHNILSLLLKKAADKIVNKCIENIYPPLVVNINENNIYINIGGDMVKSGSLYDIYSTGEKIIDPYTKESLGAEETKVATLRITEVKPKYSVGILEQGNITDIQKGNICRPNLTLPKPKPTKKTPVKRKISNDDW